MFCNSPGEVTKMSFFLPVGSEPLVISMSSYQINQLFDEKIEREKRKQDFINILSYVVMQSCFFQNARTTEKLYDKFTKERDILHEKLRMEKDSLVEKFRMENERLNEKKDISLEKLSEKFRVEKDSLVEKFWLEKQGYILELEKVKHEKSEVVKDLLLEKGKLNLRGAVEYCRVVIGRKEGQIRFDEPIDQTLKRLENCPDFMKMLKKTCDKGMGQVQDVLKCLGGLYHNLSKDYHGTTSSEIAIYESQWSSNEVLAFILLFRYCNVPFKYYNKSMNHADPPV